MSQQTNENDMLFKLVKIYLVEYLTTVHGFKCFQQEAINMLAVYVIKTIRSLALQTKRVVSFQGRKMPNCLHLIDVMSQNKIIKPIKLIEFLNKQRSQSSKNVKLSYSGLQAMGRRIFEDDTESINNYKKETLYPNIKYIPSQYTYNHATENPLPIKVSTDEGLSKPAEYTYKDINERVQKQEKSIEQLSNYSVREMRRSYGILNSKDRQMIYEQKPVKKKQLPPVSLNTNKFSVIKYI